MVRVELLSDPPNSEVEALARSLNLSKPLATVLWQRGHRDADQARAWLKPGVDDILDPFSFADMERAVDRVQDAIRNREKIIVHGDYDVDGITGTVLLLSFFRLVGADCDYHIPDRAEGYSFSDSSIQRIREGGHKVCISVDNGTAAIDEVAEIQALGCDVIVTDHHHTGPEIAPAYATLNPRLEDSGYPFPHLAGCGVAFKFAWAIAQSFSPYRILSDELRDFLLDAASLVALGSVADVVPLHGENRAMVRLGLRAILQSPNPGLRALIDVLGPSKARLHAEDISFRIGPRLNAAGRMEHASLAVKLLCANSYGEARKLAAQIEDLNRKRQRVEARITEDACRRIDNDPAQLDRRILCVWGSDWHIGVVGIVAARLADRYHRPAIVLSVSDGRARGSGRSGDTANLKAVLDRASSRLTRHGGHAAAVGLELPESELEAFAAELEAASSVLPPLERPPIVVEARAPLGHWSTSELRRMAEFRPFGQGNPYPRFLAEGVRIGTGLRRVGPGERGLTFTAIHEGTALRALAPALGHRIEEFIKAPTPWRIVYTPRIGAKSEGSPIELFVHAIEHCETAPRDTTKAGAGTR